MELPHTVRKKCVVVVDEDRAALLALTALLEAEGFETHGAQDAAAALLTARKLDPDAVLVDIALPLFSGWNIARHIRERRRDARPLLIAMSARVMAGGAMLAQVAGFDGYLVKPCDGAALRALLAPLRAKPGV